MAAHGIATHSHNKVLGMDYKWGGNPFISNLYFKTLASKPQYNLANGLAVGGNGWGVLAGDKFGRPLNREVQGNFCLHTNNWWNTSLEDSGPWYFRPMTHNSPAEYDEDLRPRRPCFKWNYTTEVNRRKHCHYHHLHTPLPPHYRHAHNQGVRPHARSRRLP